MKTRSNFSAEYHKDVGCWIAIITDVAVMLWPEDEGEPTVVSSYVIIRGTDDWAMAHKIETGLLAPTLVKNGSAAFALACDIAAKSRDRLKAAKAKAE